MNLQQDGFAGGNHIRRYNGQEIQIGEHWFQHSLLLSAEHLDPAWGPSHVDDLNDQHLEQILALSPELTILGTGKQRALFHSPEQQRWLHRIPGMEIMETSAACRTYNLLLAEGRKVVAALILER